MGKLFKKLQSKRKKGFTLIEVLVVVIILGALAAAAVPTYNKIIRKSRVSDGLHVLEMLANAQEKYYIENGFYAQNITQLKAPFKELRRVDPANPFWTIETTNFRYTKDYRKNCLEAESKVGNSYTLIKNYKSKEPIVCRGSFCNKLTDYVPEINNEQYATLCRDEYQCTLNQQQCTNGTHFFPDTCTCDCSQNAYVECIQSGGVYYQDNCYCNHNPEPCSPEGNTTTWGADCPYTGPIPEYGNNTNTNTNLVTQIIKNSTKGAKGTNPSTPPGGLVKPTCGIQLINHICNEATGQWKDTVDCVYKADYCASLGEGYVLNTQTCECVKECPKPQPSVQEICGVSVHPIEICDPCSSQSQVVPGQPSTRGGIKGGVGEPVLEHCCGYRNTNGHAVECNYQTGQWQCVNNNPCTRVDSDEIGQPCDGSGTAGSQCGIKKYNGCKLNDSFSGADVLTLCVLNVEAGNECYDGETKGCIMENGQAGVEHCVGCHWDGNCVPGGGEGCEAENPICQPGETQQCLTDPNLTQTCTENCEWGDCGGGNHNCDGIPMLPMKVPEGSQCAMNSQSCVQDDNGNWGWVYTDEIVWQQLDFECETGWVAPCNDPTDSCDNGQGRGGNAGGGKGGGKGGRAMGDPCCDPACRQNCEQGCAPAGQIPDPAQYEACVTNCINNENGGLCDQGGSGTGPGGGGTGGCMPPAQGCYIGYHYDYLACQCVRDNPGQPPTPPAPNVPTKICQNCKWSCCSHCDFSHPPEHYPGYSSQCAYYRSQCGYWDNEAFWIDGKDYYEVCKSNTSTNCEFAQWFGDNECEIGRNRLCNSGTGRQYCTDCHWGPCNPLPNHVSNIQIVVNINGQYKYCPDGVVIDDIPFASTCDGDEYGCWLSPHEEAHCRNNNTQNISKCNLYTYGSNYESYCRNHPGTKCIIDDVSSCYVEGALQCCPGWENSCGNAFGNCTETVDCAKDVRLLECD